MKKLILLFFAAIIINSANSQDFKTENIFLITLDGLRWQELFTGADPVLIREKKYTDDVDHLLQKFWSDNMLERREKLMPFMWNTIAKEGQIYGNRNYENYVDLSNPFWFSYPGYNEILTGMRGDTVINSNSKINNPNVTILEYLNKSERFTGKVAAFGSWDVFPYIVNEERSGVPVNAGFEKAKGNNLTEKEQFLNEMQEVIPSPWSSVRLDAFTHGFALEYLKKYQPNVLYIAYGETDDFAHDGEFHQYLNSAHRTDQFISELWDYVQSTPKYKNKTTFIISTDHGRGVSGEAWKSHGTSTEESYQTWFAVMGPDIPAKGEIKTPGQHFNNQYAATIAWLLGIDGYKTDGKKLTDIVSK